MSAQILDGKVVRDKIAEELKAEISRPRAKSRGSKCKLVIIQIGDLAESNTYITQKVKFGEKIGATVEHIKLPEDINQKEIISKLYSLNSSPSVHGVIVQLPLPNHLDKNQIIDAIDPKKDVDGQTATNIKLLFEGSSVRHPRALPAGRQESEDQILDQVENDKKRFRGFVPATTKGIITLLDYYKIPIWGQHVVIVGRSSLVGKPTALAFLNRDATVTICHSKTKNLANITKGAHILIVAAGKSKLITKDHVTKGQIVIDVGINIANTRVRPLKRSDPHIGKPESEPAGRKLTGDVDFEEVSKIVAAISPVPGGCGPMTVASLYQNLLDAYNRQK